MRIVTTLCLGLGLLTGACTDPDGRIDPGATLGLAAGLAALGGVIYLATENDGGARGYGHHGDLYRSSGRAQRGGYQRGGYQGSGYQRGGYQRGGYQGGGYRGGGARGYR